MLTYPDRQKFEQIRARWEAVRLGEDTPAEMVGWREKSVPQQPVSSEPQENGSSRFRRKLSHGLAFISNPLSQRKTTPGRHQANVPLLATTEPSTTDLTTATPSCETLHSSTHESTTPARSNDSPTEPTTLAANDTSSKSVDADATPKPLPRSRTLSFIPLPVRTEQESFSADVEGAVKSQSFTAMPQPKPDCAPSKIPTPSPPLPERRQSSPRQYLHHHASYHAAQQIKQIAAAHAAAASNGSPVRPQQPLRSRTTPNFVNGPQVSQPARYMAPRRPGPKRPAPSPMAQKPFLQENFPIDKRVTHRRSQIQEVTLKRESLAVPGALNGRRSFGPSSSLAQNRSHSFATPPTTRRLTSHLVQRTPVTVKRIQPQGQYKTQGPDISPKTNRSPMVQPRRTGPPAASTPPTVDVPMPPTLPRSHTDRDLQRKTLGTPNGLGGVWRSSRALAMTTHEVSRLPRSHTFHSLETQRELAPPVPRIPDRYRTPSLSDMTQRLRIRSDMPIKPRHTRIVSDATSCASIPETDEEAHNMHKPHVTGQMPTSMDPAESTISLTAFPPVPISLPSFTSPCAVGNGHFCMEHSIPGLRSLDRADISVFQVKDYMPPLYWAGRFTSRYDQWRTDAMIRELDLNSDHQTSGPLSECKLSEEKLAKCYIFGQLRDLCTSDQAADSLWEFEYKYRKDHRMLGNHLDLLPLPSRKQDDNTTSMGVGAFGRAMRKLTPRKASLVNLIKGKGWNKSDETKNTNLSDHDQETSSEES
ncbi:hypothetical protein PtrSN002B_000595 [Pyrenophora tritici-repentis]|uniref:Atrophin-1 multi-domain protein n=2 Tax=Pyrenophora tritici-repentis TaxID=45151 RepID=A0A2W1IFD8_9PLEO|nr:uncharacterized protein PTRG_08539 [Pyrenophora tritici-repentis Pt-1C-BFP]KAF7443912.1 hypothetical protein A1F99_119860 [Pyrenophora tritici-repentis]EDU51458.1 conserved hypothetical protein [Pyrenophora tritici-repentis Pt-1C-BFP]KAF7566367.1 Atrophin-1 multi-domain protein [Pyrenophora tritici-repentis]KAI0586303.1 hypothetical protein Alg215_02078 [Pyrenophora tritici-repentis]KAI0591952.1 hypothetical protein Alg130_00689 [Pyrenophora tritici-repentis]